jgi:hypothetical protein
LVRFKKNSKHSEYSEDSECTQAKKRHQPVFNVNDFIENGEKAPKLNKVHVADYDERIDDWYEVDESEKTEKVQATVKALEKLKDLGGKCYDILRRFFYDNQTMDKIAYELGYTNADNVKNQKARCQKKLKEIVLDLLTKK